MTTCRFIGRAVLAVSLLGLFGPGVAFALNAGEATIAEAAQRADSAALDALLKRGADVNAPQADGTTALHWAAHYGDVATVNRLLKAGAVVTATNRYGIAPLWMAARNGHAGAVEALLRAGADPETHRADSGETVLMIAAKSGSADVVERLVAYGADVNAKEAVRGQTALMWAAAERHSVVARVLADAGADLEARSSSGITPLMFAIRRGDIGVTKTMLDLGAKLENKATDGTAMLVLAIINAHWELASYLLERGADANTVDPHGSPLHVVAWMRRADNRGLSAWLPRKTTGNITSIDLAKALLARGARVNARNDAKLANFPQHMALGMFAGISFAGATPLFIAARNVDVEFIKFLVANGADPLIGTNQGVTPLLAAAGVGYATGESPGTPEEALEAVKLFQQYGNDVKAVANFPKGAGGGGYGPAGGWDGSTAIYGAVIREAKGLVEYLIEQEVQLDHKNKANETALDVANGSSLGITYHVYPELAHIIREAMVARGITVVEMPRKSGQERVIQ